MNARKPRVLFVRRPYDTSYPYAGGLALAGSLPRSAAAGGKQLQANFGQTGNKGNMAISEALIRMFDIDREHSCSLNLPDLLALGWDLERVRATVRQKFDLVVFGMENAIRPRFDLTAFAMLVEALDTPFVVLGIGLQNPLSVTPDAIPAGSWRFLEVVNRKALFFGVRGRETLAWLHANGLAGAQVLGCPSLFLYPANFLGIKPPQLSPAPFAITAGQLQSPQGRAQVLFSLFRDSAGHYVLQSEMPQLVQSLARKEVLLDDATGRVDAAICRRVFTRLHGAEPPFKSYWYFQTMDAWRVFCARADYYLGDRLHGGIVAMQAGVPAIILWQDLRVRELTALCAIPNADVDAIGAEQAGDLVKRLLTPANLDCFRTTYQLRLAHFDDTLAHCGLQRDKAAPQKKPLRDQTRTFLSKLKRRLRP